MAKHGLEERVVIRWAGEIFRVPVGATHYELYPKHTAARRNMYRLDRAVCEQLGAPAWDIEQANQDGGKEDGSKGTHAE